MKASELVSYLHQLNSGVHKLPDKQDRSKIGKLLSLMKQGGISEGDVHARFSTLYRQMHEQNFHRLRGKDAAYNPELAEGMDDRFILVRVIRALAQEMFAESAANQNLPAEQQIADGR